VSVGDGVSEEYLGMRVSTYGNHERYVTAIPPGPSRDPFQTIRPIPNDVKNEVAVFSTIAEIVMNGIRRGRLRWGESVVVFGLGLLGQLTARICCFAGAIRTIGVDLLNERCVLLRENSRAGARVADDWTEDEFQELNNGR
jgi:threonine dehydrogenase-like Zn-dependent dehydrogenase